MVTYVERPPTLSGCWASWAEADQPVTIRTPMEDGTVKVRRRWTGVMRVANVSVVLSLAQLRDFMRWFRTDCAAGTFPTNMVEPDGTEAVWRFAQPPQLDYIGPGVDAVTVSCTIERLPGWQVL